MAQIGTSGSNGCLTRKFEPRVICARGCRHPFRLSIQAGGMLAGKRPTNFSNQGSWFLTRDSRPRDSRVPEGADPRPLEGVCPTVLFAKGDPDFGLPLLAVFNSRKPRIVSPDSNWLGALRFFFNTLESGKSHWREAAGPLLTIWQAYAPCVPEYHNSWSSLSSAEGRPGIVEYLGEAAASVPVLSCMLDAAECSARRIQLCRDRMLAALANLHLVLEIRSGGNLLAILDEIQAKSPRPQFIFEPGEQSPSSVGNYALLAKVTDHSIGFKLPRIPAVRTHSRAANKDSPEFPGTAPPGFCGRNGFAWGNYLFHYTRACPAPGRARHTMNTWPICLTVVLSQAILHLIPSFELWRRDSSGQVPGWFARCAGYFLEFSSAAGAFCNSKVEPGARQVDCRTIRDRDKKRCFALARGKARHIWQREDLFTAR